MTSATLIPHRHRKLFAGTLIAPLLASVAVGEEYRQPPAEIVKILEAPPTPAVSLNRQRTLMVLVERENMPPVAELAKPMLRLAGARINPQTNGPFSTARNTGYTIKRVSDGHETRIQLPADVNVSFPSWSPDGSRFAFTITRDTGIELWTADAETAQVRQLTGPILNVAFASAFDWMPDSQRLICRLVPANRGPAPAAPAAPTGPVIQETRSVSAPVRTFQDLLQNAHDERLFEYYMTAQLAMIDVTAGGPATPRLLREPCMYSSVSVSPSGRYLLVSRKTRPFSYLVTAGSFPEIVEVWDNEGNVVREIARLPLREDVPIEGVPTGPRSFTWQSNSDEDALFWVEALDDGDPRVRVAHRDKLMRLAAPFDAEPIEMHRLQHRYSGLSWMQLPNDAMLREYDRDRRWSRTWLVKFSSKPVTEDRDAARLLWDRSIHDRYGDPGTPITTTTDSGRSVVLVHDNAIYLAGSGATRQGDRPFLDRLDLETFETQRLWQCGDGTYEYVVDLLDPEGMQLLTRYESLSEPPNYFIRDLANRAGTARPADRQITHFEDPAPQLRDIRKQIVTYDREDGVKLSATLYLPADYQEGQRLPLIVWAYPREFNDPEMAGQVSGSPYRFTTISGSSHLFLLTQGYAVMDGAAMPVVGDPETMNDTFIEQIVASAKACIDKAVAMGVADGSRVGVGGHSYGAFMTANLLAHSDLFRAGVARSGAYNRTLTPFGFQSERRTLWEAPQSYINLSPFMAAHKINEPILLIHGQIDNNSGTFPMQSERLYQAIKGNGGHARLVMLPYESHGYAAKESVLHTLAEMIDWFDAHVKYAEMRTAN